MILIGHREFVKRFEFHLKQLIANGTDLNRTTNIANTISLYNNRLDIKKSNQEICKSEKSKDILFDAMNYSSIETGGKRIRPLLLIASADTFGVQECETISIAAALELIHISSLIHDDLPAMDDDDMRRGMPSCHRRFDEATAILAGDALSTLAFELISNTMLHSDIRIDLVNLFTRIAGCRGMILGQSMDLKFDGDEESMLEIHIRKTSGLFIASMVAGGIIGKVDKETIQTLEYLGILIGIMFQILDDALDFQDGDNLNMVRVSGIEKCVKVFEASAKSATQLCESLNINDKTALESQNTDRISGKYTINSFIKWMSISFDKIITECSGGQK